MKRTITAILAVLTIASLFGCGANNNDNGSRLNVVTTIFPPYDFAREIGGELANVTMLIKPGAEVHSFEPSPQDIIAIGECDVFIYNGGESDEWVKSILDNSENDSLITVNMTECVTLCEEDINAVQNEDEHEHHDEAEHDEHEHDDETGYDEHVWTSPKNAILIAEKIRDAFCAADAENEAIYISNANKYVDELSALDSSLRDLANGAADKLLVFADRFPFLYMFNEYGLEHFAAFPGCADETEPSAATITRLIDTVNEKRIPVVFYIEFSNQKLADTVSAATGAKKLCLHSCHNVTAEEFESGATYISLMRTNISNLQEALS